MNNFLYDLILSKKVYVILGLVFVCGIFMINYSNERFLTNEKSIKTSAVTTQTFTESNQTTEYKLRKILAKVDGVGAVDVFINYRENAETISSSMLLNNRERKNSDNHMVEGIIIVAQGGGDAQIISLIRNSVSESFGIPLHKVVVLKMSE